MGSCLTQQPGPVGHTDGMLSAAGTAEVDGGHKSVSVPASEVGDGAAGSVCARSGQWAAGSGRLQT